MDRLIALVEDNDYEAKNVLAHFKRLEQETGTHFDIRRFKTGGEFLSSYKPIYDIVLLDIVLTDLSGMDVAKCLRELDDSVVLIFTTSFAQYALEGYEVSALDFMIKPVTYTIFKRKIERGLLTCTRKQERELLLNLSTGVYRTSSSRIKYIEIQAHNITFHTTEGILHGIGSLKNIEEQLDPFSFARCHRSFLVNLCYVRAIRGQIAIVDGEELPISRPKRLEFMKALNNYIGGTI